MGSTFSIDSGNTKSTRQANAARFSLRRVLASDTFGITLLTLSAFAVRLWDMGGRGLW